MTRFLNRPATGVVALFLCVSLVSPAVGQMTEGKTAFDHLKKTTGVHAPGSLVEDGVFRAEQKVQLPFGGQESVGLDVTATERTQNPSELLVDTLVDAMFVAIGIELSRLLTDLISSLFSGITFDAATTPSTSTGTGGATTPGGTTTPDVTTPPVDTTGGTSDGGRGGRRKGRISE